MKRKLTTIALTTISLFLITLFSPVSLRAEETDASGMEAGSVFSAEETETVIMSDGEDTDALFEGYVDQLFYGGSSAQKPMLKARKATQGSKLSGWDKVLYDQLSEGSISVAAGEAGSTIFSIDLSGFEADGNYYGADDLEVEQLFNSEGRLNEGVLGRLIAKNGLSFNLNGVINAVLSDHPYEMYWYDKIKGTTGGYSASYYKSNDNTSISLADVHYTVSMCIAAAYADTSQPVVKDGVTYYYAANQIKTGAASEAARNAQAVITENREKQDYDKLLCYKNMICDAVSYDSNAANDEDAEYGDPWQLINVFDNDSSTNVVCEGYSKAFQYLCDQSTFTNEVVCNSMSGSMYGGTGAGSGHMWNVIRINDGNYIADITNSDAGTVGGGTGSPLFLKGNADGTADGYDMSCANTIVHYRYDNDAKSTYTDEERTLSKTDFDPADADHTDHNWVEAGTILEPTCEEAGVFEYRCDDCGLLKTEEIEPLGHDFQVEYQWSADYQKITASKVCSRDRTHISNEETVSTTRKVIEEVSCEAPGRVVYESDLFDCKAYEIQTSEEIEIPATGHSFGEPKWQWNWTLNADESGSVQDVSGQVSASAEFQCVNECGTVRTIPAENIESVTKDDGTIDYTARLVFEGKSYTSKYTVTAEKQAEAKQEAEERAKQEAEEKARQEAEEKAKQEAEERAKQEAEERAKQEAEEKAKQEAEEKAKKEAEEKAKKEAEEKARQEAEERAKQEAEEKARQKAAEAAAEEAAGHKTLTSVEKSITALRNDTDLLSSEFAPLTARVTTAQKTSLKLQWSPVKDAEGYLIYAAKAGRTRYVKAAALTGKSKKTYTLKKIGKKLSKNTYYKILVAAYKTTSYGEKRVISVSKVIHASTAGGKYQNPARLQPGSTRLTLKKGKKAKLTVKQINKAGSTYKKYRAAAFESSNPKIAAVTAKGVVKGKKKGSCLIYIYAQNGLYKKIKVTVK